MQEKGLGAGPAAQFFSPFKIRMLFNNLSSTFEFSGGFSNLDMFDHFAHPGYCILTPPSSDERE